MLDDGKKQRRMTASILVKAILEWGGKGKDLADYLGVSQTTISHWRSIGPESQRKPAVPSEDHIVKLLGILNFRIEQNIFYLKQMIELGGIDRITSTVLAITAGPTFNGMGEFCSEKEKENGSGLDRTFDELKKVQESGGPSLLRPFLEQEAFWGDQAPTLVEDIKDEPLDLDAIKESLRVDQKLVKRVKDESQAYPVFFSNKLR